MRVLFTSTPGWGHIHPMAPLAHAFQAQGDEVAWAVADEAAPRLEQVGFQVFRAGLGSAEAFAEIRNAYPEMGSLRRAGAEAVSFEQVEATRARFFPRMFGAPRARPMLRDLLHVVADWNPQLVVHVQGELAAPIAAAASEVSCATHSFGQPVPAAGLDSTGEDMADLWASVGLTPQPFGGCFSHAYIDIFPSTLGVIDSSHIDNVQPAGPGSFATGEVALPEWIHTESTPIVYVTFGTVFNDDPQVIRTVVEGVGSLPVRLLVTVGPHADPAMLGDQPGNVHVERYVPQTELLPHCAAVVSHAGSGTFLASLSEGLPQVCVPQGADQFANAEACARGGVGRTLLPGEVTAESVRAATEDVLADKKFRVSAERVQREIAGMPRPDEVADSLTRRLRG